MDLESTIQIGREREDFTNIYDASQFAPTYYIWTKLYGLPRNYFDVVQSEYYVEKEVQEGVPDIGTLSNGDLNPIDLLYSTHKLNGYPETTYDNYKNAYNISVSAYNLYRTPQEGTENTLPIILPGALQGWLAIDAGDTVKLSYGYVNV